MSSRKIGRTVMAGLMAAVLSGSMALAQDQTHSVRERAQAKPLSRAERTQKSVAFQNEHTDSWLCLYVSPFFCSNLYPTLDSATANSTAMNPTPAVPDRSRR